MNRMSPAPAVQRAMLEERIQMYQAAGFEAFLDAEASRAQTPIGPGEQAELEQRVRVLGHKSANCYASAARLAEMLAEIPADPESPAG
ncbi:MAG TPA: hypothetical protein VGB66_04400 [Longimicrobium sp.]